MAEQKPQVAGFSLEEEEKILEQRYHKAKRGRMTKKKVQASSGTLNINSMMDLMTIILVFLLVSSNEQSVKPEMSDELFMPWSTASDEVEDAMTITISQQAVLVNDEIAVSIRDGDIPEGKRVSATSPIIPDLQAAVEDVLHVEEQWAVRRQDVGNTVVTIIADHGTTYQVLTYVMMTASAAGIQEFKFAILQRNDGQLWNEGDG